MISDIFRSELLMLWLTGIDESIHFPFFFKRPIELHWNYTELVSNVF